MANAILTLKICNKCNLEKPLSLFPLNRNVCKHCRALQKKINRINDSEETKQRNLQKMRDYARQNREALLEKKRDYYLNNKEKLSAKAKERYLKNSEIVKLKAKLWKLSNKERKAELNKQWANKNKSKILLSYKSSKAKRRLDPVVRINDSISAQIRQSLFKSKNCTKWQDLVGYTKDDLINHLISKMQDGMTLDNYGKVWHIDHIRPVVLFEREGLDVKKCWALENLQPLFVFDNLSKGAKYYEAFSKSKAQL